jgi:hypothetical protein
MRGAESIIQELQSYRGQPGAIYAVHYACQRLDIPAESPGISAIGFRDLYSDESSVFSRVDRPGDQELYVLSSAFAFIKNHHASRFIHFKMNTALFGFEVLRNRFAHIANVDSIPDGPPVERTFALNALIEEAIDPDFADSPQLKNLIDLNRLPTRHFLAGDEEAKRFADGDHTSLKQSLAEKIDLIAKLGRLLIEGDLQTKNAGPRISFAGTTLDSIKIATSIAENLRAVARPLVDRRANRPAIVLNDEYDYQDLYHSMLRIFFRDVRAEEFSPSVAGANSRIDFVLPPVNLAIELKDAAKLNDKAIGDQLLADVERYASHPTARHLVCLIFDYQAKLKNPAALESGLTKRHSKLGVTVRVITS